MARPTKYDPLIARLIIAHVATGKIHREAASAAGISLRSVQYWLARGREGEPPFAAFARRLDRPADEIRRAKVAASFEREAEVAKDRWQAFKASRERWWLDRLGPLAFWSRRLAWCQAKGKTQGAARARATLVALVEAERERRARA